MTKNLLLITPFIFFCAINFACTSTGRKKNTSDEASIILSSVNNLGRKWLSIWGYQELRLEHIKKVENDSLTQECSLSDSLNESELFKIYSQTRKTYIDIYSGSYAVDSSSKQTVELISDPETTLQVFYNNKFCTFLHYGYSIVFHDAFWINESEFIIVGYRINDDDNFTPLIWFVNLLNKRYSLYEIKTSKNINDEYIKRKFLYNKS